MVIETSLALLLVATIGQDLPAPSFPAPDPLPPMPGPAYEPPLAAESEAPAGAPRVYEHSPDAGPDQSFYVVGDGLGEQLFAWGRDADDPRGRRVEVRARVVDGRHLFGTLPDRALDAPVLVWFRNDAGWSSAIRLNVPEAWWVHPQTLRPGITFRVFGRDLARRPDRTVCHLYLARPGQTGVWLSSLQAGKYTATARLPEDLAPGDWQLWVYAGCGGRYAWSAPLPLTVEPLGPPAPPNVVTLAPPNDESAGDLQDALDALAARGGGVLQLADGVYPFVGTLRVPADVTLRGSGRDETRLQLLESPPAAFAMVGRGRWNQAPSGVHTVGDTMAYRLEVPEAGEYQVWLRYATEMSPWNQPGVSSKMSIAVDDGPAVVLEALENTGSFGAYRWTRSATIELPAGEHTLRWRNERGGGLSLDAFVFARDPAYEPSDSPWPQTGEGRIVVQGEDVIEFRARDGALPNRIRAAVWLSGNRAAIADLTVSGSPQVNIGVEVRSPEPLGWIADCRVTGCRIADIEGKTGETIGVELAQADRAVVRDNVIFGRAPIWLAGVRGCEVSDNLLLPATRYGDNALAAIVGRTDVVERCVVEGNRVGSPPGAEAGGPQVMRLIWVSTGRGSITHNWFAGNGVVEPNGPGAAEGAGPMRFGGVAGREQNVGEMILFEGNHRTMYFGPLSDADGDSVTLPRTVPPTPDERLGSVQRGQLAYDAEGNETPFWPPEARDESDEPPLGEYYVSVFAGPGQGQTRRVVGRDGERLLVDRPWRTPPEAGSIVAVGTAFYRNHIVGNYVPDGMTGIQLWISCVENIAAGNSIARMRRPAFYLYSNGTTLASSMPRTWNRGISPLFFNQIEGNRAEECSAGVLLTSGDSANLPVEFPRALGNVIRQNSFVRNRTDGLIIVSRKGDAGAGDTSASIVGTVVEFNVVRDAPIAYHAAPGSDVVLFRRNHAYFWYPVNLNPDPPVAFAIDPEAARVILDSNTVEGKVGELKPRDVIEERRSDGP